MGRIGAEALMRARAAILLSLLACGRTPDAPPQVPADTPIPHEVRAELEAARDADTSLYAKLLLANGLPHLAVEAFELRLAADPGDEEFELRYLLAHALGELGDDAQALVALDAALGVDRGHGPAHRRRAELLIKQGRLDDAEASLATGASPIDRKEAALLLAWIALERGDARRALDLASPYANLNGFSGDQDPYALYLAGIALRELGEWVVGDPASGSRPRVG